MFDTTINIDKVDIYNLADPAVLAGVNAILTELQAMDQRIQDLTNAVTALQGQVADSVAKQDETIVTLGELKTALDDAIAQLGSLADLEALPAITTQLTAISGQIADAKDRLAAKETEVDITPDA